METMGKLRAQKHNWRHMMIISFMFYVGDNEALVNKIEVLVNDTVSIHCYTNPPIDIQWHFNSFLTYVFAGGKLRYPYNERFRTDDDNAGTYTLIIPKARSDDAGWYYCQGELSGRLISSTHLTVLYSDPVCYSNMHPDGFIGPNTCNIQQENMVFNCVVSFNGTYPHLIWRLLNDNRTLNSSICEDKPNRRNCSLILKSDPIYDGSIFICQTTASINSSFNCSTEATKILYFSSTNDTVKKYVNDNVNCSANSNLNLNYNWTLKQNNKTAFLSSSQTIEIQKPGIYQCEVNYNIRNYSCLSIASVMNVNVESTNGGTTYGTTTMAILLPTVLVFVAFSAGVIIWIRKRRKQKRENERRENDRKENERRENEKRENERRENDRRENERIRKKIDEIGKDFVSEVDPEGVLEPLIQENIISIEDRDTVLNKEKTREDNCRALLDHLSSSSHREALIVLKEALFKYHPRIAERVGANDDNRFKEKRKEQVKENERIRDRIFGMYNEFVSEVDPDDILQGLYNRGVIKDDERCNLRSVETKMQRCSAVLDRLYSNSDTYSFLVLKQILKGKYDWVVDRIDADDDKFMTRLPENERIKDTVIMMYKDFISKVDPSDVFDLLIQNGIVSLEEKRELTNKDPAKERCRALIDHLFCCSKENAFIILREALKERYPQIAERIVASVPDNEKKIVIDASNLENRIRNNIFGMCQEFGSNVDLADVFDLLIQNKIINPKERYYLTNKVAIDDRWQALLDILISCPKEKAFIILKEALKEHYPVSAGHLDADESSTQFDSCAIVVGIYNDDEYRQDVMKININSTCQASIIGRLPPRVNAESAAAVYGNSLFVTGVGENFCKIWKFDARSSKWEYCNTMIRGRRRHSVAFVDHVLYICGGWVKADDITLDDVEAYDTIDDRCTTVGKLVHAVQNAGNCVPFKSSLYIFGGQDAKGEEVDYVQVYDTKLSSCILLLKRMPVARCLLRAVLLENKAILLGYDTCLIYNFDKGTWQTRGKFKADVIHFGMIVHNGNLVVIGGVACTADNDGQKKWVYRKDIRSVSVENVLNNGSIEWLHHPKLPKPTTVYSFGKMEFLVQNFEK